VMRLIEVLYFRYNVFQIGFVILAGLTFLYYIAFVSPGWCYSSGFLFCIKYL